MTGAVFCAVFRSLACPENLFTVAAQISNSPFSLQFAVVYHTFMDEHVYQEIRGLLDDYLRMYSSREDRLTTCFSENFSGFTADGDLLVKSLGEWIAVTRRDLAQVKGPIRIELKDFVIQSLAETTAVATCFFNLHLPLEDQILSRQTARLVLIFSKESGGWKISHSSTSIPCNPVGEGEVDPLRELMERNRVLEEQVAEQTRQLSETRDILQQTNSQLSSLTRQIGDGEAHFRLLTEDIRDVVWRADANFCFTYISPADEQLRGYRADEVIGRHVFEVFTEEGVAIVTELMRRRREIEENGIVTGSTAFEAPHRCKDGRVLWGEVLSKPERDANGKIIGYHGITREITERKQAEIERKELEVKNRQLQKSESLGRMAGAIAHHFNNQLGVVIGNLDLATIEIAQETQAYNYVRSAMEAADQAAEMSGLMLTYLGNSFDRREPLDLSEICSRSLPMLKAIVPAGVEIETDLPSPGPVIMVNSKHILQVLINLTNNAWEAMNAGEGTIGLCVKTVRTTDIPAVHRFPPDWDPRDDAYACLEVVDEGCGIGDEHIDKLFDPFFSTKLTGRGMGLAVVLGIARAHGAAVTVASKPGHTTAFRVFLPICEEPVLSKPSKTGAVGNTPIGDLPSKEMQKRGTVLVVEDEEMIRDVAAAMLKRLGFSVIEAKDGVEAVELFREHQDVIRCVICDLSMPRLNGWDTLTALRKILPGIPVILASGYDEAHLIESEHHESPQVFMSKPYGFRKLSEAIESALQTTVINSSE